jgi:mono/diheme cytochrome c family protein
MKGFLLGILLTVVVLIGAIWFAAARGYINFAADQRPSAIEEHLSMSAVDASTERRASEKKNPFPTTEDNIAAGAKIYLQHCGGCHGVPSNPDSQFARSFYPPVPRFFKKAPDMPETQNFYMIQHGIRWTGMPAWNRMLTDDQIWLVVTFLSNIGKLPPAAQKAFGPENEAAPQMMAMPKGIEMKH